MIDNCFIFSKCNRMLTKKIIIALGLFRAKYFSNWKLLAPTRVERVIFGLGNHCSILLSYEAKYMLSMFLLLHIINQLVNLSYSPVFSVSLK